ncbi:MAG TPA: 16S rRNA (cytidine(1402)-2'-O)-methyltransferase [Acidimicrobiia bacterium]|nr:16S rRNA (cytidine(1402)-2'-O)-methyltransferase [Acidimicrobiia bacterium]
MAAPNRPPAAPSVTFQCHGHPRISGSHTKTVELTRDAELTARATCVLGVRSEHDDRELGRLRGDVEVTLECAGVRDSFTATMSAFFLGDDALVFRRGPGLRGRTLAYDATKVAADIDRDLVRAAGDPDADVSVTIRELGTGDRRGALFVVSVPIGNDDDLSPRARQVLGAADLVLAEDTRRFRDLTQRTALRVDGRVISYHDHNEAERAAEVLAHLERGARVALVSDAGTPLFSDPGYVVVSRAVEQGFAVSPVPGPASMLAVLSASGLAVDRFTYVGFLPRRSAARQAEIRRLTERGDAFVVHEAPRRLAGLLADLAAVSPEWDLCIGREVTKVFEEFRRGSAAALATEMADTDEARGEFTIVAAPPADARDGARVADPGADEQLDRLVRALLQQGVTPKTLAKALGELPGVSHKEAYARVLAIAARV